MLNFIYNKSFVVLQILLDVDLEFDYIVEHLFNFCVQLFAQRIRLMGELLVPRSISTCWIETMQG
jgi:hypothetical protein